MLDDGYASVDCNKGNETRDQLTFSFEIFINDPDQSDLIFSKEYTNG